MCASRGMRTSVLGSSWKQAADVSRVQDYRLRSFEMTYVQPRLRFLDERGLRGPGWLDVPHDPTGHVDLQMYLLREAANWIDLGRACGYFSSELDPVPIVLFDNYQIRGIHMGFPNHNEEQMELLFVDWEAVGREHRADFADRFDDDLRVATEDLTDDRLEFLRLYLFAADSEWNERVAELEAILGVLEITQAKIPNRMMDLVTWALQGPESALRAQETLPSDWRSGPYFQLRTDTARRVPLGRFRARVERLGRAVLNGEVLPGNSLGLAPGRTWTNEERLGGFDRD